MSAWEGGRAGEEGHVVCSHRSRCPMLCNGEPRGNRTITPGTLGSRFGTSSTILFVVPAGPNIPLFPRWHQRPQDHEFRRALRVLVLESGGGGGRRGQGAGFFWEKEGVKRRRRREGGERGGGREEEGGRSSGGMREAARAPGRSSAGPGDQGG